MMTQRLPQDTLRQSAHDVIQSSEYESARKRKQRHYQLAYKAQHVVKTVYQKVADRKVIEPYRFPLSKFRHWRHRQREQHTEVVAQAMVDMGKHVAAQYEPEMFWGWRLTGMMEEYCYDNADITGFSQKYPNGVMSSAPYFDPLKKLTDNRLYISPLFQGEALLDTVASYESMAHVLVLLYTTNNLSTVLRLLCEQHMEYTIAREHDVPKEHVQLAYDMHIFGILQDASITSELSNDVPFQWQEPMLVSTMVNMVRDRSAELWQLLYDLERLNEKPVR